MAISIKTQPGEYYSVHGDLLYVVHEATKAADPVTYPDYRYIADVYVDTTLVTRLKAYPHPDTLMGVFNIGNILRNYITPVFNPSSSFDSQNLNTGDFNVSGTVIFGEEYGFTLYPATIGGVGKKFFGHYNGRLLGTLTNLSAYYGKVASVRPDRTSVYRNSQYNLLPYFQNASGIVINIDSFREDGTLYGGVGETMAKTDKTMQIFNIAPGAINTHYASPTFIDENVAYYVIDLGNSRRLTVDLVCESKYTVYTIHFLNRFGGFESRDFTKVSRKTIDIEKKDFGKLPYTVNASGEVSYYNSNNVYNETRSVYASQYKEKMVLNTDAMTDQEYTWLGDLIISPMVYIEMDGYFLPVVISSNNYEFKKSINDKITNLTINIEFGDQFNAQYR